MNELLREIEDDIRRERFEKLWHSFGKLAVGVSLIVILATIITVIVQNRREARAMEQTAQFVKGVDRVNIEDYNGAITIFDSLAEENKSSPIYGLSLLRKAQAQNGLKNFDGAAQTYQALAQNSPIFGGLAKMMASPSRPDQAFAPDASSPFYHTQREWLGWQLMQQSKKDEAVKEFAALYRDGTAPNSQRQRMLTVLQHIAPDQLTAGEAAHE